MSLRFHEIAESSHRILNPFSADKLRLLGEICQVDRSTRVLDLCCGKAEMLCTWAVDSGASAIGVDISEVFLAAARQRAAELQVGPLVTLVHAEAAQYAKGSDGSFDVVSCLGATWIGGGLTGTLELMRPRCAGDGLVLVGEPFWLDPLPDDMTMSDDDGSFVSLSGTLERIAAAGYSLVEMVASNVDDWDRYVASQWMTVSEWLRDHPDDPDSVALGEWIRAAQTSYLSYQRRHLGWAVFVLRPLR